MRSLRTGHARWVPSRGVANNLIGTGHEDRMRPLARTPLHNWHAAHGAHFAERGGWLVPLHYGNVEAETRATQGGLAMVDLSPVAKLSLLGRGVATAARALCGADVEPRRVGKTTGRFLACRLTGESLLLLSPTPEPAHFAPSPDCVQSDVTMGMTDFGLLGSGSEEVLLRLTALDVSAAAFPAGSCAETSLAGIHALLVRPAAPTAWHICVAWDLAEYLWERLLDAGRRLNIVVAGWDACRATDGKSAWKG